jgi:quinol monooxygenase YgiN
MSRTAVIYEVNLRPDPSIEAEFDEWLEHHVREMVRLPGFVGATIYRSEDPGSGEIQRTTHYRLRDRAALEDYFREHAERMRADGIRRFGDRFSATRRILDEGPELSAADDGVSCANCEARLTGQYCADCGQRAGDRMISVWELVKEASEVLTSLDSRLWRTLGMLLFRPGRLTSDYLLGRRARYIPALRLFLGLSLVFFFLFSIDTSFGVEGDGEGGNGLNLQIQLEDDESHGSVVRRRSDDSGDHVVGFRIGGDELSELGRETATAPDTGEPDTGAPDTDAEAGGTPEDDGDPDHADSCSDVEVNWPDQLAWMNRWLSTERVTAACEKIVADHGASFGRALLENIPLMMFAFVPFMALLMKFFYPLTGRYYVEHLLFLVHYHSFFYLLLGLGIVLDWLLEASSAPETPRTILFAVFSIYIPVYLFRAMRVVYRQGIPATAFKYMLLGMAYLFSLALMLAITVTVTAVTL